MMSEDFKRLGLLRGIPYLFEFDSGNNQILIPAYDDGEGYIECYVVAYCNRPSTPGKVFLAHFRKNKTGQHLRG
jgi:hypothetical protein